MKNSPPNADSASLTPQKTILYDLHKTWGGQMVNFANWLLPVRYTGSITEEHQKVRQNVGLFDVSHMGEFRVRGPQAVKTLQWLTSNNVSSLKTGRAQYSLFINKQGGIIDDLIIYCLKQNKDYLVCVNASNTNKDFQWISQNNQGAILTNESNQWSLIAVQGPKASILLGKIFKDKDWLLTKPFDVYTFNFEASEIIVARTGYTGEWGVEIFVENQKAPSLWKELLDKGEELGVAPIGLGARNSLRLEMKFSLYGHEIDEETNPYEAGLGWAVKAHEEEFLGGKALKEVKERGLQKKLVGFKLLDRGIPRQGYLCFNEGGEEIGIVTSGTMSPTLGEAVGIGYVKLQYSGIGCEFLVNLRGRSARAIVVKTPFVSV